MIHVLSQDAFDDKMVELGLDDSNVENYPNSLFVSIIGTKDSLDEYLHEEDTKHYFQANHTNVINLDFDDVDEDTEYNGVNFKAMSINQSDKLAKFLDDNISNDDDMEIYIHCRAGISRSRAVAEYIARHYQVSYDEDERKSFYSHLNHGVLRRLERSYKEINLRNYEAWGDNCDELIEEIRERSRKIQQEVNKERSDHKNVIFKEVKE